MNKLPCLTFFFVRLPKKTVGKTTDQGTRDDDARILYF